jgi:hypothetical protein
MIGMTDARLRLKGTKGSNRKRIQRNSATSVNDKTLCKKTTSSVHSNEKKVRKKTISGH